MTGARVLSFGSMLECPHEGKANRQKRRKVLRVAGVVGLAGSVPGLIGASAASAAGSPAPNSTQLGDSSLCATSTSLMPTSVPAVPQSGLDPSKVTAAQLVSYGLPDRPNPNGPQPQWWNDLVRSLKQIVPGCAFSSSLGEPPPPNLALPTSRSAFPDPSNPPAANFGASNSTPQTGVSETTTLFNGCCWAGYQDVGGGGKNIYSASSDVVNVPTATPEDSEVRVVSAWAGIGTGTSSSDQLIQTGSYSLSLGFSTEPSNPWVEMYPGVVAANSTQFGVSSPAIAPGDLLYEFVKYQNPYPVFELFDETSGVATGYQLDYSGVCPYNEGNTTVVHVCDPNTPNNGYTSGLSADAIVELPFGGGALAWFGTVPFSNATADYNGTNYSFNQLNNQEYIMYRPDTSAPLWAIPGAFNSVGIGCTTSDIFCVYRSTAP